MKSKTLSLFIALIILISSCTQKEITVLGEAIPSTESMRRFKNSIEKNLDNDTKVNFLMYEYAEMNKLANFDFAGKTGIYDIVLQYNTALAPYVSNNYVFSINEIKTELELDGTKLNFLSNIFVKTWKEVGCYQLNKGPDNKAEPYAIPFSANTMFIAYNKEMFENQENKLAFKKQYNRELLVPKTWSEYYEIAKFFTNTEKNTFGTVLQGDPFFIYYEWANFAYSFGGGVMKKEYGWESDRNTPIILNSKETIEATNFYLSLKEFDGSNDFFSTDASKQLEILKEGKTAIAIIWSDVAYNLVYNNNSIDNRFGFAPIPGNISMLAGGSYYINKQTSLPKEAMKTINYLMQEENQIELMKNGLCSPLKSIYNKPAIKVIPYSNALYNSLERGVYMLEAGQDAEVIIDIMTNKLQNLFKSKGQYDTQTVLSEATEEIKTKRKKIFDYLKNKDK